MEKDPIAQAMARKRWNKATEEDRKQVGADLAAARQRARSARSTHKPRLSKRIVKPILSFLLWYFLAQGASLTIVGPFGTQTACENYRAEISEGKDMLADVPLLLSWPCWSSTPETGPYRLK